MAIYQKHILPVQTSLMIAVFFTGVIFTGLPLLTKIHPNTSKPDKPASPLVELIEPPPLPDVDRDKREPERPREMTPRKIKTTDVKVVPEIPPSVLPEGVDIPGIIEIPVSSKDIVIEPPIKPYKISQVDRKPRVLRAFPPQYPYLAKRKNVEGSVVLRFVVDKDGYVRDPEVYSAEPEGVFDDAALKAIAIYKFQPAIKDGESVDCIVRLPIIFDLR